MPKQTDPVRAKLDNRAAGRPMGPPHDLRALRLWHWRLVVSNRASAAAYLAVDQSKWSQRKARTFEVKANWHLAAVQVLDDCFPVGDTAEQDDAKATGM